MIKVGDCIAIIKRDNSYYVCGRAEAIKEDCRRCNFFNEKPCKVTRTDGRDMFEILAHGYCDGIFHLLGRKFDEHFIKVKPYSWKKL